MTILNNADGYVTIDGDPGSYPGAKPSDFLKVFLADRQTLDRAGERPEKQKLIPWIWSGWGTKGVWVEPIEPYVQATLAELKRGMPEPWELLPGRSAEGHANKRVNIDLTAAAGLLERSTLLTYEAIEFEPSLPSAVLQFDLIRNMLRKELPHAAVTRGCFGNAQQPVMVIPNLYFYARCAAEPSYLSRPDEQVAFGRFVRRAARTSRASVVLPAAGARSPAGRSAEATADGHAHWRGSPIHPWRSGPVSFDPGRASRVTDSRALGQRDGARHNGGGGRGLGRRDRRDGRLVETPPLRRRRDR